MINNSLKEKIKVFMNVQELLSNKRVMTDSEWDRYFIENYNNKCELEIIGDSFITYEIYPEHIFIKDMVCFGEGFKLLNKVLTLSKEINLPIRAMIHITNEQVLNVIQKRFNFKIISLIGNQYLVERK